MRPDHIRIRKKNEQIFSAPSQSRIDLDMLLRRALPAAHFNRNAATPVTDLVHC
jgi:hypothetical protein